MLSHQRTYITGVSVAPGELAQHTGCSCQARMTGACCHCSPHGAQLPHGTSSQGHPTPPQCLRVPVNPLCLGINAFNSCLPSGLQISVLFLA